jgi:hypothetical protein
MVTEGAADTWAFGLPEESLFHVGLRVLRKKGKEKIKRERGLRPRLYGYPSASAEVSS